MSFCPKQRMNTVASNILWIGEYPSSWNLIALRHLTTCLDGKRIPLNGTERSEMSGDVPYWGANGVVDYIDKSIFNEDLVLIGEDGAPFFDKSKSVAFKVSGKIWPNNHIHVLRPNDRVVLDWLVYALNAVDYANYIEGSTRDKLTQTNLNSILLPVPQLEEQKKIADFLDRETEKIDGLIKKQERLIELIEERRKEIINKTVTRGLEKSPSLESSGLSWLGKIPAGWGIKPLKYLISFNDEVLPESTPSDFEIRYVEVGDVSERFGISGSTEILFKDAASRARRLVKHGDVLVSTVRTYLRAIAAVTNPPSNMVVSTGFAVIRPRTLNGDYARFLLSTEYFLSEVISRSTGVSYPAINAGDLVQIKVPVPPIEEQEKIAEFIQRKCAAIDLLLNKSEASIRFLKEHRASLISAAVTGKIDVPKTVKQ